MRTFILAKLFILTHALAAGILALGPYHGGAIEGAMQVFAQYIGKSTEEIASVVHAMRENKQRIPGFGHKKYTEVDPRAEALLAFAKTQSLEENAVQTARMFESALEKEMGRKLVLNIDGAVAALLIALGFAPSVGNGIFALARVGGMLAHIAEEQQQGTVVRRLEDDEIIYTP